MIRLGFVLAVLVLAAASEFLWGNLSSSGQEPTAAILSDDLVRILMSVALGGALVQALVLGHRVSPLELGSGVALCSAGLILRSMAMMQLGGRYRMSPTFQADHQHMVTSGCYGRVRHPGYLALSMLALGLCLLMSGVAASLWVAPLVMSFVMRIRLEEGLLMAEFGDPYRHYQVRVPWKIVPHVF